MHLLFLALSFAAPQDTGTPDRPEGRVLFTRQLARRDDLFVLHLPDGRIERLTDHAAKDSHGVPSPDGARIVFNSERVGWWKVWTMDADGSGVAQASFPTSGADYYPSWSPDGRSIVYVAGGIGNGDIVRVAASDTRELVNLTHHDARDNFPAWSPTGELIAFASDRDDEWSLFVMNTDGEDVRRLTSGGRALEPSWFPDGRSLAYQSTTEGEGVPHLWKLALEDGTPTQLTHGPDSDERPAVSPDGEWIVFESDRAGGSQLFLLPSSGGTPYQLTHEGYCYGAAWFPAARESDDR